jgi:hypothetical protein
MSLLEKVNQEKNKQQEELSVQELLQETKELNELMKSYISVQMDREAINSQTVSKEIQAIENTSEQAQEQITSITEKQRKQSIDQLEQMRNLLNNYLDQMQEREEKNEKKLENLNEQIVSNTKKGLELINQNNADLNAKIEKKTDSLLERLNQKISKFSTNFKFMERQTFLELVLPTSVVASAITMLFMQSYNFS